MSDTTTKGVRIQIKSVFVPERSSEDDDYYFFAYRVRISNVGEEMVQLVSRHWVITDGNGDTEEVEGAGIIGATPWLPPSAAFEYTSYCPLSTPSGMMHGSLLCSRDDGSEFTVEVPPFDLLSAEVLLN